MNAEYIDDEKTTISVVWNLITRLLLSIVVEFCAKICFPFFCSLANPMPGYINIDKRIYLNNYLIWRRICAILSTMGNILYCTSFQWDIENSFFTGAVGRGRGGVPPSSMGARPITGAQNVDGAARPMTAVRAAGFTSYGNRG